MLKIKDNVDLKELEKYGFEYCGGTHFLRRYSYTSRCGTTTYRVWVRQNKRILSFNNPTIKVLDIIYDLIKDGLVEKVKE